MFQIISTLLNNLYRYYLIFLFLYFLGRILYIFSVKFVNKNFSNSNKELFFTKISILFPVFGYFLLGNILLIANYFFPISNFIIKILLFLIISLNLLYKVKLNFYFSFINLFNYIFLPLILLASSYDTSFHYDAGFYHLNHQNWIRESNIVIGMVNIFWPFGIASLNEYVLSFFWTQKTLINLHFLSLIFLHTFYIFIYHHIFERKNSPYKYASIFILIFGFLDNFGFLGGRNGYFYIQEIGKPDIQIAVLVVLVSLFIYGNIAYNLNENIDIVIISLLCLFTFQLKIGSFYLFVYFAIYLLKLIFEKSLSIKKLFINLIPLISFSIFWFLKSYLISGCFIFPVEITCLNNFSWFRSNTTKIIEIYTSDTSFGFRSFVFDNSLFLKEWFNVFFKNNLYSEFYKSYYLNFLISFIFILFIKVFLTKKRKLSFKIHILNQLYIIFSLLFLFIYGPIPRYSIGILIFIIAATGFNIEKFKVKISKHLLMSLFFIVIVLTPRLNSYKNLIQNKQLILDDPRYHIEVLVEYDSFWKYPQFGDQCWINLDCTSEIGGQIVIKNNFFKTVIRNFK